MRFFDFFKIVYDEVFVLQLLAVSFTIVWVFYDWKKDKKNIAVGIAHFLGIFAVGTVLNWLLFALSSVWRGVAGIHFHIAWLLTIFIYLGLFDRTYVTSRLIMGATVFVTVIATADLGHEVLGCLMRDFSGKRFEFVCYLADAFMIAFSLVIHKFSLKQYSDIPPVSVILIMVDTVASTAIIIIKTVMKMTSGMSFDPYYCLVLAFIYVVSVTGYIMIYFHCKVRREKTALEVQNKLLEADKQMLVVSGQAIEEMRAIRHDMKNQYKVMELMLRENRYEDLKNYFSSAGEHLNHLNMSEFINCGNQLVNSIVNMEILKATSYGVKLITKINVPPELPFGSSDLCRVLVNLIDNAIEAILRTESRDYLVDVQIGKHTNYLYICVQNEIRDDIDRQKLLKLNTVKDDAANHGYGHKIVKHIVEKYNGFVNYTVVEKEFIAEVMLDMSYPRGGGYNLLNKCINVAVCDDDEIVCEAICSRLCKIFKNCGISAACDKYVSPVALYKNIESGTRSYNVLFLDIDMPKMNGVELAQALRKDENETDIIFVSNREDKVFETFPVRPFGFVRKNNFTHDLNVTMRAYINAKIISNSFAVFKTANNSVTRKVRVSDIVYIESFRYKQYVYMSDGEQFEIHMTMKELETNLEEFDIIRVYQGYIVNLKYVQRIDRTGIILNYQDGVTINISRDKVQELKGKYLNYLRKIGTVLFDEG